MQGRQPFAVDIDAILNGLMVGLQWQGQSITNDVHAPVYLSIGGQRTGLGRLADAQTAGQLFRLQADGTI